MQGILIALLVPAIIMVVFTRVTYNTYVSFGLTILFMWAVFGGIDHPIHLILLTVLSSLIGFYFSMQTQKKNKKKMK
jgi:general stress protein CsbA